MEAEQAIYSSSEEEEEERTDIERIPEDKRRTEEKDYFDRSQLLSRETIEKYVNRTEEEDE